MNYLAHLFLSDHEPQKMVGNFIADFVRGNQVQDLPLGIQQGIKLHHKIDQFTDQHPIVYESKLILRPLYGKYAAVLVDVFYDHFLSRQWQVFSSQDRQAFCEEVYQNLKTNEQWLPTSLQSYLPDMIRHNWLYYYGEWEGVRRALQNLANRSAHRKDLAQALSSLQTHHAIFEQHFLAFFPELIVYCKEIGKIN